MNNCNWVGTFFFCRLFKTRVKKLIDYEQYFIVIYLLSSFVISFLIYFIYVGFLFKFVELRIGVNLVIVVVMVVIVAIKQLGVVSGCFVDKYIFGVRGRYSGW